MKHPAPAPAPAPRRLPRWLRRTVRAWTRAARWLTGHAPRRPRGRFAWCLAVQAEDRLGADDPTAERRCGWFDSSQDLREGLNVSEHGASDAVCAQLSVMAWVQLQLGGWQPDLAETQVALAG